MSGAEVDHDRSEAPTVARWWCVTLALAALGAVLRVVYVLVVLEPTELGLDAATYALQGGGLRGGGGYSTPASLMESAPVPTAGFPPLYATYQAVWQSLAGETLTTFRLAGVALGIVTTVLVALLARRVLGPRRAWLAAALAALSPTLIAVDGSVMSEGLTVPLVTAVVLLGHRVATRDGGGLDVVGLALMSALAVLTRQDLALLVPLVVVPSVLVGRRPAPLLTRLAWAGAAAALVVVAIAPWAIRNERALGSATISTTSPSSAMAGANCDATYHGPSIGSWDFGCVQAATPPGAPEAEVATRQRQEAVDHVRAHLARVPVVIAARQARVWSVWDPRDLARRDAEESRRYGWQLATRPLDAVTTVAGIAGLVLLVRRPSRRTADWLLWAPLLVVAASATLGYGNPRFAAIAHPSLLVGITALAAAARPHLGRRPRHPTSGAA